MESGYSLCIMSMGGKTHSQCISRKEETHFSFPFWAVLSLQSLTILNYKDATELYNCASIDSDGMYRADFF